MCALRTAPRASHAGLSGVSMKYVVAIDRGAALPPDAPERLAAVLGVSLYDARPLAGGAGPRVVALKGDAADAATLAESLRAAHFSSLVIAPEDVTPLDARFSVRTFRFDGDVLRVVHRDGRTLELPLASVELMVRGRARRFSGKAPPPPRRSSPSARPS